MQVAYQVVCVRTTVEHGLYVDVEGDFNASVWQLRGEVRRPTLRKVAGPSRARVRWPRSGEQASIEAACLGIHDADPDSGA